MSAPPPQGAAFAATVVARLQPLGPVTARRMFGGHGVFLDDAMLGLIAAERLYFKTDAHNRAMFEARGLAPFTYATSARRVQMSYHEAPDEAFDEPEVMLAFAEAALAAARRAAAGRRKRRPGRPS